MSISLAAARYDIWRGGLMRTILAAGVFLGMAWGQPAQIKTGPAVGERIPAFSATDQNGKLQTLKSLTGPKGLVLLFVRSADW